ncbi:MAG: hypothetical protein KAS75_02275 [Planctomycetes bacterium]|nr:hypothetical protein [Planctomycetota bacterium]
MNEKLRHKRVKQLVHKVNKERKKQAHKIDILCNDLISAQREFIERLDTIGFAANFYESIVGTTDLNSLLCTAAEQIKREIPDADVAFFLREDTGFKLHECESEQPITLDKEHLENYFTDELVENICKSNKICTLKDMFAMGLQGKLTKLNKVSVVTIPLSQAGQSPGFILVCRPAKKRLTDDKLHHIAMVTRGLSRAIVSCQQLLHTTK